MLSIQVLCLSQPALAAQEAAAQADKESFVAAIVAASANCHSFVAYSCTYRVTEGQAQTLEDAKTGRFHNRKSYDVLLLVSGENTLSVGMSPLEKPNIKKAIKVGKGKFIVPVTGNSEQYLANSSFVANFTPQMKSLGVWSKSMPFRQVDNGPLQLWGQFAGSQFMPEEFLKPNSKKTLVPKGLSEVDGHPVICAKFIDNEATVIDNVKVAWSTEYCFDVSCGFLPRLIAFSKNNRVVTRIVVTAVQECGGGRWFPMKSVLILSPDDPTKAFDVKEIAVLKLDVDNAPSQDLFTIDVPAGTSVDFQQEARRPFLLKQRERIGVDDLKRIHDMTLEAKANPLMDTAIVAKKGGYWKLWFAMALLIAAPVGAILWLRQRRQAAGA